MSNGDALSPNANLHVESAVRERYSAASQATEPALCCPVNYDSQLLEVLPAELIERDYGCGDPSRYVREGEDVLDLGSGGGKICYIASQIVGPQGSVTGVDMNDEMLALAARYQEQISESIGWRNTTFCKGRIQDLALNLNLFEEYLSKHSVTTAQEWMAAEQYASELRRERPMIADDSVDVVLSNCVLNLVKQDDRRQLFHELYRVLRRGGRAVVSDIVCDEPVPERLKADPTLWSGCISGAFVEDEFLRAFEDAQLYGVEVVDRQEEPWTVVEGIEFRSVTVQAFKGKEGPCLDQHQAVIYKGPWRIVTDDDGHTLRRGQRTAVCGKTYEIYSRPPYQEHFYLVPPYEAVPVEQAAEFNCHTGGVRDPRETKLGKTAETLPITNCCGPGECC